jgi:hypothetical protein
MKFIGKAVVIIAAVIVFVAWIFGSPSVEAHRQIYPKLPHGSARL